MAHRAIPGSVRHAFLHDVEFIPTKTVKQKAKPAEATDAEIPRALEANGLLDFYYDESQDVYTLEDGEPI